MANLPTSLNPFSAPVPGMETDTVSVNTRGNDNAIATAINALITALGGSGAAVSIPAANVTHGTFGSASSDTNPNTFAGAVSILGVLTGKSGDAGEVLGNVRFGGLAQVSGAAVGFNLFTPTINLTYHLRVAGKDVADGGAPNNAFIDEVVINATGAWTVPTPWHSQTLVGSPGARTYTNNTGAFHIALANGSTWYIDVALARFAS